MEANDATTGAGGLEMKRNLVRWELSALVIVGVMFMKGCIQNQLLDAFA